MKILDLILVLFFLFVIILLYEIANNQKNQNIEHFSFSFKKMMKGIKKVSSKIASIAKKPLNEIEKKVKDKVVNPLVSKTKDKLHNFNIKKVGSSITSSLEKPLHKMEKGISDNVINPLVSKTKNLLRDQHVPNFKMIGSKIESDLKKPIKRIEHDISAKEIQPLASETENEIHQIDKIADNKLDKPFIPDSSLDSNSHSNKVIDDISNQQVKTYPESRTPLQKCQGAHLYQSLDECPIQRPYRWMDIPEGICCNSFEKN